MNDPTPLRAYSVAEGVLRDSIERTVLERFSEDSSKARRSPAAEAGFARDVAQRVLHDLRGFVKTGGTT